MNRILLFIALIFNFSATWADNAVYILTIDNNTPYKFSFSVLSHQCVQQVLQRSFGNPVSYKIVTYYPCYGQNIGNVQIAFSNVDYRGLLNFDLSLDPAALSVSFNSRNLNYNANRDLSTFVNQGNAQSATVNIGLNVTPTPPPPRIPENYPLP